LHDRNEIRNGILPVGTKEAYLPVNMERIIENAQRKFNIATHKINKNDLNPLDIINSVNELNKRLVIIPGNDRLSIEAQHNATLLFSILLRQTLNSKRILEEFKL